MPVDFLTQLAQHLKIGKSPVGRRAIQRIVGLVKVKYESGIYVSQTEAEGDLRTLVEEALRKIQ